MSFNPAVFLFLNPELNIPLSDALAAFNNNPSLLSSLDLPANFDDRLYLAGQRQNINISGLNNSIRVNMMSNDVLGAQLEGEFMPTLYEDVQLEGENLFRIKTPGASNVVFFNSNSLNVGDEVKIIKDNKRPFFAVVNEVVSNEIVRVQPRNSQAFKDAAANYMLYGIKVWDRRRLASISYLRQLQQGAAEPVTVIDPTFNAELYKLLYPHARNMSDLGAFVDYNKNPTHIASVDDFGALNASGVIVAPDPGGGGGAATSLSMSGLTVTTISTNYGTTSDYVVGHTSIITEKAIKKYVDQKFVLDATFAGAATFNQAVNAASLRVTGAASMCNIVSMRGPVSVGSNLTVANDLAVTGDGSFNRVTSYTYTTLSDARLKHNVKPIDKERVRHKFAELACLSLYSYEVANGPGGRRKPDIGLLADEVEQVFPELISSAPDMVIELAEIQPIVQHQQQLCTVITSTQALSVGDELLLDDRVSCKVKRVQAPSASGGRYVFELDGGFEPGSLQPGAAVRARIRNVKSINYDLMLAGLVCCLLEPDRLRQAPGLSSPYL